MNENNELSDIVLDKNSASNSGKKMVLAIATLGIILIAVVTIMKSCGNQAIDNTPQKIIPPQPIQDETHTVASPITNEEPLFEEVEVVQESMSEEDAELDKIAQKLKEESQAAEVVAPPIPKPAPKVTKVAPKPVAAPVTYKPVTVTSPSQHYYVQVGSFSKPVANKKLFNKISNLGYNYKFHKAVVKGRTVHKLVVGPFTKSEAKEARVVLRSKVEPGAFLVNLK